MSNIESRPEIEYMLSEYKILCSNFESIIKKYNLNTTIEKTKLGFYKRKIDELDYSAFNEEYLKLFNIINKLISLNILFNPNINIQINYKDLLKIIEGSNSFDDTNEAYNDTFFELDTAIRFLKKILELGLENNFSLNLDTGCDIIVGTKTAIECKYIHSKKRLEEQVKKAIKQIDARISDGLAEEGIIAIDLTHIMDHEKFNKIAQEVFSEFYKMHEKLSIHSFASDWIGSDILASTIEDSNFIKIVQSYHTAYLEQAFFENLNQNTRIKIKENLKVKAVIFQSRHLIVFKSPTGTTPIMNRGMTYYLNESLPEKEKKMLKGIISNLAVGI